MAFPIVAVLISEGVSFALGQLRPKVKKQRPQDLEGWIAQEGRVIPYLSGIAAVEGNVTWWGDTRIHQPSNDALPPHYNASLVMRLLQGPINDILDLQAGGKSIRFQVPSRGQDEDHTATTVITPALPYTFGSEDFVEFDVNARQMFGGDALEGGIERRVRVYKGSLSQSTIDELTSHSWSAGGLEVTGGSAYPGVCYAAFGKNDPIHQFYWGTVAQPKSIVWILTRYPRALLDLGFSAPYVNPNTGETFVYSIPTVGFDSNPAETIFELSVDRRLGTSILQEAIDVDSLVRGAALWQAEQFGQSVYLPQKEEAKNVLDELLKAGSATFTPHPVTGLLTFTPLRNDYAIGSLLTVTDNPGAANCWDLEEITPLTRDSYNEIQLSYQRFAGAVQGGVTNEPLGTYKDVVWGDYHHTKGKNISNVVVRIGSTEITPTVDYLVSAADGLIVIFRTDTTVPLAGQLVTADYISNPETMRFEEAHVTESLLGDQLLTDEVRPLEMESPYTTSDLVAAKIAGRAKQSVGRPLKNYRWKMNRQGYALYPGAVCKITSSRLGLVDFPVRVGDVDQGTLEAPTIEVMAVEDIWAQDVAPTIPSAGSSADPVRVQAPSMGIGCGLGGSNVRIAFFPSDTNFLIRLWQADDEAGTNRVKVDDYVGTTAYYDTATTGKFYQAQLVQDGCIDGPLTPYITCSPSGGSPVAPTCTIPVVESVADDAAGTVSLTITDTQNRVPSGGIKFRHRSGNGTFTDWTAATLSGGVYKDTVALDPVYTSRIEWEVTYLSCSGDDATFTGYHDFVPVASTTTTTPALTNVTVPVDLFKGATLPIGFRNIPAARTPLIVGRGPEVVASLAGVKAVQVLASIAASTAPVGAYLSADFEAAEVPGLWNALDGGTGPLLPIDPASLDALDPNPDETAWVVASDWFNIRDEAQAKVRVRAVVGGGNDTGYALFTAVALAVSNVAATGQSLQTTSPAPDDPGSCTTPTTIDDFSYANLAALDAAWPVDP